MRVKFKSIICLALCLFLAVSLCACGKDPRSPQDIIEELAVTYGRYGSAADGRVNELLDELSKADKPCGEKWAEIMELWKGIDTETIVNIGTLPDGLPSTDELCIVALGFQLNADGSMKDELVERLKVVLACAEKYPNALVVCTGGGTATNNPSATEAGVMAEWLIEQGLSAERIIVENKSLTTVQNAQYTCAILAEKYPQVNYLAIASSDYHIATGTLFFEAECILRASDSSSRICVISNAAYEAPSGSLSTMFQAGGLVELSGDIDTAFDIYYDNYDIHELPELK